MVSTPNSNKIPNSTPSSAPQSSSSKKISKKWKKKNKNKNKPRVHDSAPKSPKKEIAVASTSEAPAEAPKTPAEPPKATDKRESQADKSSGFIFMCSGKTKPECYRYRVFGLPKGKIEVVEKIKPGARLFLYDFDLKLLYGIYRASSKGGMNLEKDAFRGAFPAQVKFKIEKDCLPLPESTFKPAIIENYHKGKFTPELNSKQVRKLMSLFRPVNMESHHAPPVKYAEDRRRTTGPVPYEDHYRPVQLASPPHLLPEDPYRSGQLVLAPPQEGLRYIQLAPSGNDRYAYSEPTSVPLVDSYVHSRVPGAIETQHVPYYQAPAVGPYQVDPVRSYHSDNLTESVIRYRYVPEIVPRDPLLVRDYQTVGARDGGEVLQRGEPFNELYNPERTVLTSRQPAYWPAGHEDPSRAYADNISRPATNGSAPSTIPVSSIYSFAGAYR